MVKLQDCVAEKMYDKSNIFVLNDFTIYEMLAS